ncbi:MAG TPA: flagellar motor stator protein MotA [Azoarcus sp.]|nr:flagellar motor stator protein MotA [Azoarcus sp.]
MLLAIGYVIVLLASVGTYALHGNVMALWVPIEYIAIFGLMVGAFVGGTSPRVIKSTLRATPSVLRGERYDKALYINLLSLLYEVLAKVRKEGLMAIEDDIEAPESSALFQRYPDVLADHHAIEFLTDYLRMMVGGNLNAFEIESLMDAEIATHHEEAHEPAGVFAKLGDALPAFGIVVAVMGVVNVMGSVGEPPAVLGKMLAGALVGTFLGILLSYGFVQPIASQLTQRADARGKVFGCIKAVLLASMNGYAPQVAVEFGRKALYVANRPGFIELEEEIKSRKQGA